MDNSIGIVIEFLVVFLFAHSCELLGGTVGKVYHFFTKCKKIEFVIFSIFYLDSIGTYILESNQNHQDINQFLGSINSFRIQFKLFNIFEFNYELLYILMSVCVSYVVVLVQFEIEAGKEQKVNMF